MHHVTVVPSFAKRSCLVASQLVALGQAAHFCLLGSENELVKEKGGKKMKKR